MNKQEYNNQYNRASYTGISFRLSNRTESDLIDWIRSQDNAKDYICSLVMKDMIKQKKHARLVRNLEAKANQVKDFEVMEDLPYHDHYSIKYTDSFIDALTTVAHYSSDQHAQHGPLSIVERGYDKDLNCYYGVRRSSL